MTPNRFMKTLSTDIHLHTAMIHKEPIVIFISEELVGSGVIEEITEHSVKVRGESYFQRSVHV